MCSCLNIGAAKNDSEKCRQFIVIKAVINAKAGWIIGQLMMTTWNRCTTYGGS